MTADLGAPVCRGYGTRPRHETRHVGTDGLCDGCRTRKATDVDPVEPPEPDPGDPDHAADVYERTQGRQP